MLFEQTSPNTIQQRVYHFLLALFVTVGLHFEARTPQNAKLKWSMSRTLHILRCQSVNPRRVNAFRVVQTARLLSCISPLVYKATRWL